MKTYYLYVTPSGSINLIEGEKMPVAPERPTKMCVVECGQWLCKCHLYADQCNEYEGYIESAKVSSVPVQDKDKAKNIIAKEIIEGAIYGPFSGEYEKKGVCCSPIPPNINHHGNCDTCDRYSEIAILLPEKTKCTCPCHTSPDYMFHMFPCCDADGYVIGRTPEEEAEINRKLHYSNDQTNHMDMPSKENVDVVNSFLLKAYYKMTSENNKWDFNGPTPEEIKENIKQHQQRIKDGEEH